MTDVQVYNRAQAMLRNRGMILFVVIVSTNLGSLMVLGPFTEQEANEEVDSAVKFYGSKGFMEMEGQTSARYFGLGVNRVEIHTVHANVK
jgi:hypothetical protein